MDLDHITSMYRSTIFIPKMGACICSCYTIHPCVKKGNTNEPKSGTYYSDLLYIQCIFKYWGGAMIESISEVRLETNGFIEAR